MRSMAFFASIAIIWIWLFMTGCAATAPRATFSASEPLSSAFPDSETFAADYDKTWNATISSLGELQYEIDQQAFALGLISSKTEFWEAGQDSDLTAAVILARPNGDLSATSPKSCERCKWHSMSRYMMIAVNQENDRSTVVHVRQFVYGIPVGDRTVTPLQWVSTGSDERALLKRIRVKL
jgi:hypothetical protein